MDETDLSLSAYMEAGLALTKACRSVILKQIYIDGVPVIQADPLGAALYARDSSLPLDNTAWKWAVELFPQLNHQIIVPEVDPKKLSNLDILDELQEEPVLHYRLDGRPFLRGKIWHIIDALTNAGATRGAVVRVLREAGY